MLNWNLINSEFGFLGNGIASKKSPRSLWFVFR